VRLLLHENQVASAKLQGLPLPDLDDAIGTADTMDENNNGHVTAQNVISQHLVPFRTINELQEQNMKLNRMVRELADRNEQFEQLQVGQQHCLCNCTDASRGIVLMVMVLVLVLVCCAV
jgi:hypothetical protein